MFTGENSLDFDFSDSHRQVSTPGSDSYAGTKAKNGGKCSKNIHSTNTVPSR